jgi:hypothetical protein
MGVVKEEDVSRTLRYEWARGFDHDNVDVRKHLNRSYRHKSKIALRKGEDVDNYTKTRGCGTW